jgi:hypothetical protein
MIYLDAYGGVHGWPADVWLRREIFRRTWFVRWLRGVLYVDGKQVPFFVDGTDRTITMMVTPGMTAEEWDTADTAVVRIASKAKVCRRVREPHGPAPLRRGGAR